MMVEIELKFITTPEAITALAEFLSRWPSQWQQLDLSNVYYETADNYLRSHDLGLRIRGNNQHYEMTLKTAGKIIAGLHQRPEYNVEISEPRLELYKFPVEVWPPGCDVALLQQQLQPLFSTNFSRETRLLTYQNSEIELALDRGEIKAGERQQPFSEIELELKRGNVSDVLAFAQELSNIGGLRLGGQSKAARGYYLAQDKINIDVRPLTILRVSPKASVEQGLTSAVEMVLDHWQYHEELWLKGDLAAKEQVELALALLRQIWQIWSGIIPRKVTAVLREQLLKLDELIASDAEAADICYQRLYLQSKLALTEWLVNQGWRSALPAKSLDKLHASFKRFADIMLSRSAAELKQAFAHWLTDDGYQNQIPRLERQILSFYLLAGAYSQRHSTDYIDHWQTLLNAIIGQRVLAFEELRKAAVNQPLFWLNSTQIKMD